MMILLSDDDEHVPNDSNPDESDADTDSSPSSSLQKFRGALLLAAVDLKKSSAAAATATPQ